MKVAQVYKIKNIKRISQALNNVLIKYMVVLMEKRDLFQCPLNKEDTLKRWDLMRLDRKKVSATALSQSSRLKIKILHPILLKTD